LSDTMSEGTVAKWIKQPGDAVAKGDILVEIETDKATMELEAFRAGTMGQILVPEGETVEIGVTIATLVLPGEAGGQAPSPAQGGVAFPGLSDGEEELVPLSSMQQTIVRRMIESKFSAPEFYVTVEIDMAEVVALRKSLNEALQPEPGITFNDFVVRG